MPLYFVLGFFRGGGSLVRHVIDLALGLHIPDHLIQSLGRWTSQAYLRYIRTGHVSKYCPAAVGLETSGGG